LTSFVVNGLQRGIWTDGQVEHTVPVKCFSMANMDKK